ncbi:MAG: phosphate signaling complex protein PhoU [Beijerinckiaceae bacterium]|jgi:phosphate transport system protein
MEMAGIGENVLHGVSTLGKLEARLETAQLETALSEASAISEGIMADHTIRAFDKNLGELIRKIKDMSEIDAKQIKAAIEALRKHDTTIARHVIASDDQVDALQQDVEQEAISAIARWQPVGVDLRDIVGAMRISNDLERIGDFAENIAKRVLLIDNLHINQVVPHIDHMAQLVLDQLARVIQSYEYRDVDAALDVWRKDQEIDALNASLFRELLTYMMESPSNITFCTHLLFCAKNLERSGDHIASIAKTVYYIVEGRKLSEERPKADITSKGMLPLPL